MPVCRPRGPSIAWVAVALLLVPAIAAPASGFQGSTRRVDSQVRETVTLPAGNWTAYLFAMNAGDTIAYDIRVTVGMPIDVFVVPDFGLADYANGSKTQFVLYNDFSNQRTVSGSFGGAAGGVAFIVDNTNATQGGADPTGPVTVSVDLLRSSNLYLGGLIFLGCGIALLAIAVVVALVLQRKKAAAAEPPMPTPYGPPPAPVGPPSEGPPAGLVGPPTEGPPSPPPQSP